MNQEQIDALNQVIKSCFNYGSYPPYFKKQCKENISKFLEVMGAQNCKVIDRIGYIPSLKVKECCDVVNDDDKEIEILLLDK